MFANSRQFFRIAVRRSLFIKYQHTFFSSTVNSTTLAGRVHRLKYQSSGQSGSTKRMVARHIMLLIMIYDTPVATFASRHQRQVVQHVSYNVDTF